MTMAKKRLDSYRKEASPDEGGELVDGPAAAARILKAMDGARQNRLLAAIKERDPTLSSSIEGKLFSLNELLELPPAHMAILIDTIEEKDILLSMKTNPAKVTEQLLAGMTERRRSQIMADFSMLPQVRISEVTNAQKRILKTLQDLKQQGRLPTNPKKDFWV
jgi:flagellar motor switch protein FliG